MATPEPDFSNDPPSPRKRSPSKKGRTPKRGEISPTTPITPITIKARPLIIRDSREKEGHGWTFEADKCFGGTVVRSLPTGDYTLEGLTDRFTIERKGSPLELCSNLTQKEKWPAFEAELLRMDQLDFAWILCEFSWKDILSYPYSAGVPKMLWKRIKVSGEAFLRKVLQIQVEHKVKILVCDDPKGAHKTALSLLKRMGEHYGILGKK